jgi:8-oxo-dGTP pyrophosphatase MutT (NUDIX family)
MDSPHRTHRFPVSVKGILAHNGKYLLRRNERDEWELIGGKLEPGEGPRTCLAREWEEEAGLHVAVGPLVDVWLYHVAGVDVLIVAYMVTASIAPDAIVSPEGSELGWFSVDEAQRLNMPEGYKKAIVLSISM